MNIRVFVLDVEKSLLFSVKVKKKHFPVEFKSLLFGTTVTILEDDDERIRQRTSDVITVTLRCPHPRVVPARAAELLGGMVGEAALFVLLALLDFKSEVCMTDEISDEVSLVVISYDDTDRKERVEIK